MTTAPVLDGGDQAAGKARRLGRMRLIAVSLLGLMAALLGLAVAFEGQWPALAWLRAFAEAALVGGLADWFAVVALFRRPLGLPFPHTAIVPRNKDRIGAELGQFVERNFLTPANILARLEAFDLIGHGARWLARPGNSRAVAAAVRGYAPRVLNAIADADVERFVGRTVFTRVEALDVAKLGGAVLAVVTAGNRHQAILDQVLRWIAGWLDQNRALVKSKVGSQSRLTPGFIDGYLANRFVDSIIDTVHEVAEDPHHPIRDAFDGYLVEFIDRLQIDPTWHDRAEELKREVLRQLDLEQFVGRVWSEIKRRLLDDAAAENSVIETQLAQALEKLGADLATDKALAERLAGEAHALIKAGLMRSRHQVASLIGDVVQSWDPKQVADSIELEVGRDLQFIRLNGTVVGGLAGLALHAILVLFGAG